ncbi:uncharacterized protein BJ171DRAFT_278644 [Polychytrium aggregatum]|uniref:uncharacterized protein n=1 Tax=Polychytrium aggregatum TaxID=110093 RepID=UPI0022FF30EB|nr:uncharacterized protein BJ171DRAFT_278644 [Polychytrium aggregatum]KAI9207629.1 hypothetical protein BJ171DRAFT_278644 [Polychytrium aggregatum]
MSVWDSRLMQTPPLSSLPLQSPMPFAPGPNSQRPAGQGQPQPPQPFQGSQPSPISAQSTAQSPSQTQFLLQQPPSQSSPQPSQSVGQPTLPPSSQPRSQSPHLVNGSNTQPSDTKTTLWMGDLDPAMDENYIKQLWGMLGETVQIKMIRDKFSSVNAGYCFLDFSSHANAARCLNTFNSTPIPGTNRVFKLNWASGGGMVDRKDDRVVEYSVFVGDLSQDVGDLLLLQTFQNRYTSTRSAKVVTDPLTGMSRGYGFVRFGEEADQQRSLQEMQGQVIGSRPIRISLATPKTRGGSSHTQNALMSQYMQHQGHLIAGIPAVPQQMPYGGFAGGVALHSKGSAKISGASAAANHQSDPNNTTVFIGGLASHLAEDDLAGFFQPFGEIISVKIPPGKGCGFVQFTTRASAELAIQQMNGFAIGGHRVRLSWGRSQAAEHKQHHHHHQQQQAQPQQPQHHQHQQPQQHMHPHPQLAITVGNNGFARQFQQQPMIGYDGLMGGMSSMGPMASPGLVSPMGPASIDKGGYRQSLMMGPTSPFSPVGANALFSSVPNQFTQSSVQGHDRNPGLALQGLAPLSPFDSGFKSDGNAFPVSGWSEPHDVQIEKGSWRPPNGKVFVQ